MIGEGLALTFSEFSALQGSLNKNPLAAIEDERSQHDEKLKKMNADMEEVFNRKVVEKQDKMNKVEREDMSKLNKDRSSLKEERSRLISKKEELEAEKKSWANTHGIEMSKFLARSTESLDGKKKKYGLPANPFKFGRS